MLNAPTGKLVLAAFNEVDPLHVFYDANADEYVGYIRRFFKQLEGRDFQTLSDENIAAVVRGSFHPSQIEKGFVDSKDLESLIKKIIEIRNANEGSPQYTIQLNLSACHRSTTRVPLALKGHP